jgi:signal transduction histidine kinase/sensor domain CHASE-containing protein
MTLRRKLLLLLLMVLALLAAVTVLLFRVLFLGTFLALERESFTRIAAGTRQRTVAAAGELAGSAIDLSGQDWLRDFVQTRNLDMMRRGLETTDLRGRDIDALVIAGRGGAVVYESGFDEAGGAPVPVSPTLSDEIVAAGFLTPSAEGDSRAGLLFVGSRCWMIGTADVPASPDSVPWEGVVAVARLIGDAELEDLVYMPGTGVSLLDPATAPPGLAGNEPLIRTTSETEAEILALAGADPLFDAVIEIRAPRDFYASGRRGSDRVLLIVLGTGLLFTMAALLLFETVVMSPLRYLTDRVHQIGASADLSRRCRIGGTDDLAMLAATIDDTLDKLEKASSNLNAMRLRFDQFMHYLPAYAFIKGRGGRYVLAGDSFRRDLLGARTDFEGVPGEEIWPQEINRRFVEDDRAVLEKRMPIVTELDAPVPSRGVRRLLVHKFPIGPDQFGNLLVGGIAIDVTDRARTEERLLLSEMRTEGILSAIPDMVMVVASDGALRETPLGTGLPERMTEGRSLAGIGLSPADVEAFLAAAGRVLRFRRVESISFELRGEDGTRSYECRMAPLGSDTVVCTSRDVTEQRRLEREVFDAQKQESLSLMAGGVAHDFRNILSVVSGGIDLAALSETLDGETSEHLGNARQACDRAFQMLGQLSMLARGEQGRERTPVDLGVLVPDTARLVLSGSGVKLSTDVQKGLWRVSADEGQMVQAFSNFIVNAREAMPSGGTLDLRLWNSMSPEGERRVMVSFADSGPGIPEGVIARIFDPYFSTKERGSGLGLAVTSSILTSHGGGVAVESSPGGTVFTVTLPAV